MKVTEVGVIKTIKIPLPGVNYSNQESTCHINATLDEGENVDEVMKNLYDKVNEQVYFGIKGGVQSALA